MKILALEGGGATATVAALEAQGQSLANPVAISHIDEPRALARRLIAVIDEVLLQAGWSLDVLDVVAAGIGPGSWTSLRIMLSTAKTLAQARGLTLTGIPTFDAVAAAVWRCSAASRQFPHEYLLLVCSQCRPGELYGKIYVADRGQMGLVQPEWAGTPAAMADTLAIEAMARNIDAPLVVAGAAAGQISELLTATHQAHMVVETPDTHIAIEIGRAGQLAVENGAASSALDLLPLYIGASAAERNLRP